MWLWLKNKSYNLLAVIITDFSDDYQLVLVWKTTTPVIVGALGIIKSRTDKQNTQQFQPI